MPTKQIYYGRNRRPIGRRLHKEAGGVGAVAAGAGAGGAEAAAAAGAAAPLRE